MKVQVKLGLTIFATGLLTALGVILTVALAFSRFEHESAYERANTFLGRVVQTYDSILDLHARHPDEFDTWLRNLVLFEADTQLYVLAADGTVLASTGSVTLPPGFKVALKPVQQAAAGAEGGVRQPYVMGDDPERMDADAVIAARTLRLAVIRPTEPVAGYLYLVCHKPTLPPGRWEIFRSSFAGPALGLVLGVVGLASLLAWWNIASVLRPLQRLSQDVAQVAREGLSAEASSAPALPLGDNDENPAHSGRSPDEFDQLNQGFRSMLATLRMQWQALRRLDHFRREGVSNLSHDLRSPLTATVACLETLEQRWSALPENARHADQADDQRLVTVALRNTRNAAQMVRSLGELAQLDEPTFQLNTEVLDVSELLDDIALRFAQRAAEQGVSLGCEPRPSAPDLLPPVAAVDVELFERAVANVLDNALKFTPRGGRIELSAQVWQPAGTTGLADPVPVTVPSWQWVQVQVSDTGPGMAQADLPHLFDRFYQSRHSVAPSSSEEGRGLGLAIVKRIAELHQGHVAVHSQLGAGTQVEIFVPLVPLTPPVNPITAPPHRTAAEGYT